MKTGIVFCRSLLCIAFFLNSCGRSASSDLQDDNSEEVTIGVSQPLPTAVGRLFGALQNGSPIALNDLYQAKQSMTIDVSPKIVYYETATGGFVQKNYYGVQIGTRIFIFTAENDQELRPLTWFASSLLEKDSEGFTAAIDDKVKHFLDAKIYEPKNIAGNLELVNAVDFVAHFIPMYAGYEKFMTAESTGQAIVGVAEMIGDAATLGLGSKVRIAGKSVEASAKALSAVVLTTASVRVGYAANQAINGQATWSTGADAFVATLEAGFASLTLIKLRIGSAGAVVRNIDEARALAPSLGRSAEDILQNGLSKTELDTILGRVLNALDDAAEVAARMCLDTCVLAPAEVLNTLAQYTAISSRLQTLYTQAQKRAPELINKEKVRLLLERIKQVQGNADALQIRAFPKARNSADVYDNLIYMPLESSGRPTRAYFKIQENGVWDLITISLKDDSANRFLSQSSTMDEIRRLAAAGAL